MEETAFREKVRKQLWFLNKKEKQLLEHTFEQNNASFNNAEQKFMKPTRFANQFLQVHIFRNKHFSNGYLFLLIILFVLAYILLLGWFLAGFIASLAVVNQFINLKAELSLIYRVLILVFAIISLIVSLYLIRFVTALFTKRLLEYKFNEKKSSY